MWIYQQNSIAEPSSVQPEELPVPVTSNESIKEDAPLHRPVQQKRTAAGPADLLLLTAAVLSGSAAAGVIRALCSSLQLEWLDEYLSIWLDAFSVSGTRPMSLFAAEYFTLAGAATLLLLLGFSAFGPVLIAFFLMLYGTGNGLLMFQLLNGANWKEKWLIFCFTALPSAIAAACLCLLATAALRVSGKIREYSFHGRAPAQSWPDSGILIRQYLLTIVLLLPLCGAASGMACIESRLF